MKKLTLFILIIAIFQANAQEISRSLLSTSGNYFSNENISISWSLGELAIASFENNNNILTQGFHQTMLSATGINEPEITENIISVFPNPALEEINIHISSENYLIKRLEIFNLQGSKLISQEVLKPEKKYIMGIDMLQPGIYMLVARSVKNQNLYSTIFQKSDK